MAVLQLVFHGTVVNAMVSCTSIMFALLPLLEGGFAFEYWRRFKFTPAQEAHALEVLKRVTAWPFLLDHRNAQLTRKDLPKRYTPIDLSDKKFGDRYEPLCRVFFVDPIETSPLPAPDKSILNSGFSCSCSFVKASVVMLAAHCFYLRHKGALMDFRPTNNYVTYVVRQYGKYGTDKKNHVKHTLENAYAAVEWWTPLDFKGTRKSMDSRGRHADIAFIKIRSSVKTRYALMPRTGTVGEMLKKKGYDIENQPSMILGYPVRYQGGEAAASIDGNICDQPADAKESEKTSGGVLKLTTALKDGESVGGMGKGGSGGPWILANDVVEDPAWSKLRMAVFAAQSTGPLDEEDDTNRCSQGSEVTVEIIDALNRIAGLPLAFDSLKEKDKASIVRQEEDIGGNDIVRLKLVSTSEEILRLLF